MTMPRPAFKVTTSSPGSDAAAEAAAALAAASILFKYTNETYSKTLRNHARQLYRFAVEYRGKYSDSVPEARDFYGFVVIYRSCTVNNSNTESFSSSGDFRDELAWAAAWLFKATRKWSFRKEAEALYKQAPVGPTSQNFKWDQKMPGVAALLAEATGLSK